jgi:hypothetical protein
MQLQVGDSEDLFPVRPLSTLLRLECMRLPTSWHRKLWPPAPLQNPRQPFCGTDTAPVKHTVRPAGHHIISLSFAAPPAPCAA